MQDFVSSVRIKAIEAMLAQDPAHDWAHIERVRIWALRIADDESKRRPIDRTIVELAAMVHDVGDRKAHESEEAGDQAVRYLLLSCGVPEGYFHPVVDIVRRVSFKGFGVPDDMPTLEGKIVQDADRLDAIGAIAIARTIMWGAVKGRKLHDPDEPLFMADNADDYYARGGRTSINHFHEKLLHLKDRMHTDLAKCEAGRRHEFMRRYLEEFDREWNCAI